MRVHLISFHSTMETKRLRCTCTMLAFVFGAIPTISDKIVQTLFFNRVISENKRIRTPPLSPPFKVEVFVAFYRQLEQGHNVARRGLGRKAIFPPFEVSKM